MSSIPRGPPPRGPPPRGKLRLAMKCIGAKSWSFLCTLQVLHRRADHQCQRQTMLLLEDYLRLHLEVHHLFSLVSLTSCRTATERTPAKRTTSKRTTSTRSSSARSYSRPAETTRKQRSKPPATSRSVRSFIRIGTHQTIFLST